MEDLTSLKRKVSHYQEVLKNTTSYRETWKTSLKAAIMDSLQQMIEATELEATVELKETVENMEAIVLSLGQMRSGIYEKVNSDLQRHLIKHNGSLIYQQLFNGKIVVLINYPVIEGYGEPRPPRTIAIYRPEELKPPFLTRHMEEFIKEITHWEDYDDDEPAAQQSQRIGFNLNFMDQATPDE